MNLIKKDNSLAIDSREIAEMIEKPHDQLMRSIRTHTDYLESAKLQSHKFFIESTYVNS